MKKRHFNIKFLLQTSLKYFTEMYWNTLLLGFYFLEKEMQEPLIFLSLILENNAFKDQEKIYPFGSF